MERNAPLGRKVTLSDIAAGCNVSRATVSLVLRGSPLVNKHTRARVESELQRQGYVYNRAAANLRRRTSSSIALVINELANPFFAEFAAGVDQAVAEAGMVTLLGCTSESATREHTVLTSLVEHGPGGIILSPAEGSSAADLRATLGSGIPMVLFNREPDGDAGEGVPWDWLALDNRRGAEQATMHLIARGHRRIAFFGGHLDSSSCRQRYAGYRAAMDAAGLPVDPAAHVQTAPTRLDGARGSAELFALAEPPTAAVCYNDAVALGLMLGLHQRGLQPGRDLAVTGFDDIAEAALCVPGLTTLACAPRERGRQAAAMLLQRLRDPSMAPRHVVAPVQLVVRQSSATPT